METNFINLVLVQSFRIERDNEVTRGHLLWKNPSCKLFLIVDQKTLSMRLPRENTAYFTRAFVFSHRKHSVELGWEVGRTPCAQHANK